MQYVPGVGAPERPFLLLPSLRFYVSTASPPPALHRIYWTTTYCNYWCSIRGLMYYLDYNKCLSHIPTCANVKRWKAECQKTLDRVLRLFAYAAYAWYLCESMPICAYNALYVLPHSIDRKMGEFALIVLFSVAYKPHPKAGQDLLFTKLYSRTKGHLNGH